MEIDELVGKCYRSKSGEEFGQIRHASGSYPEDIKNANVFAEDDSGNYFLELDGKVLFWDHETSKTVIIASSMENFTSGCVEPEDINLDPEQVISAWIDPEFAKQHGIKK